MSHYALMERLERELGDPTDPDEVFSYPRVVAGDERGAFPTEICRRLDELGVPSLYVPTQLGGALRTCEDLLQLIRVLSRRDLTVTIAHCKTYLGAISVWLAGTPEQASRLAGRVLDGAVVSFALTEREHGSDLLAGELSATPDGENGSAGFRLDGEKWLINNATRADLVCVLARTDPAGGPRGFSLLLADKTALPASAYRCLPAAVTHGVRGADISGIAFTGARVPATARVGPVGAGLEIALKSFQVTRTLCAGMSLGLVDRALRIATDFAVSHRMYDRRLVDLPHARRTLAESYADLFVAEATGLLSTRGIHSLPGELSVASAVVKYLVPARTDRTITALGQVLGARALLTGAAAGGDVYATDAATANAGGGGFQKVDRDHRIVGIFDGNTLVNLNALINQTPQLVRAYRAGTVDAAGLDAAATLDADLPPLDARRLALASRTGSSVVQGLPALVAEIRSGVAAGAVPADLAVRAERLGELVDDLHDRLAEVRPSARDLPPEAFDLARRYAECYAAAACLRVWWHNREAMGAADLWADALWIRAALARLLAPLAPLGPLAPGGDTGADGDEADGELLDRLVPHLLDQHRDRRLFSLFGCRLGEDRE